jgi:Domain of unknown function (DUF4398)
MHTPTPHTANAHRPSHPPAGLLVALIACAALITACASAVPAPTEQMAAAQAAVTSATSAGAADLAPSELRTARDKLTRAQVAVTAEQHELATRLARESQADANLAEVTARSTKARKTAGELGEGNRVLREELQRSAQ